MDVVKYWESEKDLMIPVSKEFCRNANYSLRAKDQLLIYSIILTGILNGKPFCSVEYSGAQISKLIVGDDTQVRYGRTAGIVARATQEMLIYRDKDNVISGNWISMTYDKKRDIYIITPNIVFERYFQLKNFHQIKISTVKKLTSKYSMRLYELMYSASRDKREDENQIDYTPNQLRELMGIYTIGKSGNIVYNMKNYADLEKRCLEIAMEEVNALGEYTISKKEIRGFKNKVTKVIFSIKDKKCNN